MPSSSYTKFQKNMETVERLQKTYYDIKTQQHNKGGRGAFDHITRSAILFLISAFEVYCEDIICETCDCLIKNARDAKNLPHDVRSTICEYTKIDGNKTPPLELCDEGWRAVYRKIAKERTAALNTPKTDNLKVLFKELTGIKPRVIDAIVIDKSQNNTLDPIIRFRGELAHRVKANHYVHIETVDEYLQTITQIVIELDKKICDHIKKQHMASKQPWKKTYRL